MQLEHIMQQKFRMSFLDERLLGIRFSSQEASASALDRETCIWCIRRLKVSDCSLSDCLISCENDRV